jgi:hypothetical protein
VAFIGNYLQKCLFLQSQWLASQSRNLSRSDSPSHSSPLLISSFTLPSSRFSSIIDSSSCSRRSFGVFGKLLEFFKVHSSAARSTTLPRLHKCETTTTCPSPPSGDLTRKCTRSTCAICWPLLRMLALLFSFINWLNCTLAARVLFLAFFNCFASNSSTLK